MFTPENELGVIVLFAQQCGEAGFEIVSIQQSFPDAIVRRGEMTFRVEFEYCSTSFDLHDHDPRDADLIVCWRRDADHILPILALSDDDWQNEEIALPSQAEREAAYWKRRALRAEQLASQCKAELATRQNCGTDLERRIREKRLGIALRTLEVFRTNSSITRKEAAAMLSVSKRTVDNHLRRLEELGELRIIEGLVIFPVSPESKLE